MARLRIGDAVVARLALPGGRNAPPRKGVLVGQGRDSGGPYMVIEWSDGERDLVHPHRVDRAPEEK